jgi:hypothetical protein
MGGLAGSGGGFLESSGFDFSLSGKPTKLATQFSKSLKLLVWKEAPKHPS